MLEPPALGDQPGGSVLARAADARRRAGRRAGPARQPSGPGRRPRAARRRHLPAGPRSRHTSHDCQRGESLQPAGNAEALASGHAELEALGQAGRGCSARPGSPAPPSRCPPGSGRSRSWRRSAGIAQARCGNGPGRRRCRRRTLPGCRSRTGCARRPSRCCRSAARAPPRRPAAPRPAGRSGPGSRPWRTAPALPPTRRRSCRAAATAASARASACSARPARRLIRARMRRPPAGHPGRIDPAHGHGGRRAPAPPGVLLVLEGKLGTEHEGRARTAAGTHASRARNLPNQLRPSVTSP